MGKRRFLVGLIIIWVIHVGLVLFFGMQKQGFHEDEYYSYWSVASEDIAPKNLTWHIGHDLQRDFLVKTGEQFNFDMVIKNQEEDVHPPLYYLALHVVMSIGADSFYKWFGIFLNLIFSSISYSALVFLFWRLGKQVGSDAKTLALLAGAVYAWAPSTISSVMLARMYAMSTMWTVLYAVVFILLTKSRQYSKGKYAMLILSGAAVVYFSALTHYYSLFVPFFLTLAYCIYSLVSRRGIVRMLIYGGCMLLAIGAAVITYPACIDHIFRGYRGQDALNSFFGSPLVAMLAMFGKWIDSSVWGGWLMPCIVLFAICAIIGVILIFYRKKAQSLRSYTYEMVALGGACLMTFVLLTKCALVVGEAASRYFYPVIAIILPYMAYTVASVALEIKQLGIDAGVEVFSKKITNILVWLLIVVVSVAPLIHTYSEDKVLFLYREDAEKVAFAQSYSEYPLILVYEKDMSYRAWYTANQVWPFKGVLYVENDYIAEIDDPTISEAEKIVVYMDGPEECIQTIMDMNPGLSTYTLVRHDPFYYVYLLE